MCGRIAMMQVCCCGQWYKETYYTAHAASTIIVPCDTPRWPSSTSLRHVFGPAIIIHMPIPYVPFTKAAAAFGGRFTPGQSV